VDGGQAAVLQDKNYDDNDDHCVNNPYTAEAQSPKATRPLTFKNFMDYCHDFASSVWKQSEPDRLLYAGLITGLTQDTRGNIGSPSEDLLQVNVLVQMT
jgi:hypothetical protein